MTPHDLAFATDAATSSPYEARLRMQITRRRSFVWLPTVVLVDAFATIAPSGSVAACTNDPGRAEIERERGLREGGVGLLSMESVNPNHPSVTPA